MPGDDNLCQYGGMGAHSPCLLGTGGRKAEPIKMGGSSFRYTTMWKVFPVFPAQKKLSALSVLFFVYFLFYSLGGFHLFLFFWAAVFIAIYGRVNQLHTKNLPILAPFPIPKVTGQWASRALRSILLFAPPPSAIVTTAHFVVFEARIEFPH